MMRISHSSYPPTLGVLCAIGTELILATSSSGKLLVFTLLLLLLTMLVERNTRTQPLVLPHPHLCLHAWY